MRGKERKGKVREGRKEGNVKSKGYHDKIAQSSENISPSENWS